MLRAIIFDMDGVLCDSEPLHMRAFEHVLSEEGVSITDQEYYEKYLAHDDRGSFEAALQAHGRPLPDPKKMKSLLTAKAIYLKKLMKEDLVIYPGAAEFVKRASERYSLALASGARSLEVDYVLKKAKIRDAFTAVISADDVMSGKPKPESFERALDLMNQRRLEGSPPIQASETLVIEDSPRCIQTANRLGMRTVGMATSYDPKELKDAHLVIDTLIGLEFETLEKLFG